MAAANETANDGRQGLTAASWWTVDRSHDPPLKFGATPLVERCMRAHGWSEDFATRVLEGYRNFLTFKHTFNDFDAKKLSPSIPIDQMWHQHILDTVNYPRDCQLLFGQMMQHNPDGGVDQQARDARIVQTVAAVRLKFGDDYDKEVWDFGARASDREERERRMRIDRAASRSNRESETEVRSHSNGAVSDGSNEGVVGNDSPLTIRLRDAFSDSIGEETFFKIMRSTEMGTVFETYARRKGVERNSLNFLLDGDRIDGTLTARVLELDNNDQIDVFLQQSGC